MKQFWRVVRRLWQPVMAYGLGTATAVILLVFKLNTPAGLSAPEVAARNAASNLHIIIANPLYAPHKLVEYLTLKAGGHSVMSLRLVSVAFGLLTVYGFYRIVRTWYTYRIAVLGTVLFAGSAWFLHTARLATPDVLYFGALGLIWCGLRLRTINQRPFTLLVCCIMMAGLLYVPGLVWFIVPAIIWQRRLIGKELAAVPRWLAALLIVLALSLLTPLGLALVQHPALLKPLLGVPDHLPRLNNLIANFVGVPEQLFIRHLFDPAHWLARLPLLDVFGIVMFVLGLYSEYYQRQLDRVKLMGGMLVGGGVLIVLHGPVPIILLMPCIYLVIVSGVTLMLQQWFTVFPRNPLARSLGLSLMMMVIALSCFYQLRHYFVAWPQASATHRAFHHPELVE